MKGEPVETANEACKLIARECVAVRIRMLNRVITALYDDLLRPVGLTVSQLNLLVAICRMEHPDAKRVGRTLQMDPSTLSRNLDRMRKQGWLRLTRGKDARTRELKVTAKGQRIILHALPKWEEAQKRALEVLESNLETVGKMASTIWARSFQ